MRRAVLVGGLLGATALTSIVVDVWRGTGRPQPADPRGRHAVLLSAQPRVIEYRGVRVPVPAGWEVHDLDREPGRCVRFDRHAVYLGRPGEQTDCPARLVGRTEALYIEPLDVPARQRRRAHGAAAVRADELATRTVRPNARRQARFELPHAGVTITGVYGADPAVLQRLIRATRLTSPWPPGSAVTVPPSSSPSPPGWPPPDDDIPEGTLLNTPAESKADTKRPRTWAAGKAFDTCAAPSLRTMTAWRRTYRIANIYIGGAARACAQPNLKASWVRVTRRMGYRLIPTYVGLQAPCSRYRPRFTYATAAFEGTEAAVDAADRAEALGIPRRSPIYLDIEAYDSRKAACRRAVLRFAGAWTRALRKLRYVPGVYSNVNSAIRDLGRASGISKPTVIWYAHWDGDTRVYRHPSLPAHWWPPHRRIKQYRGGHKETHGGVTLNVDSNYADGRVC